MLGRLLALFLIVPIVELALLIQIGGWIGFWPTVGIIALTGLVGTYLARREGLAVWKRFNERLHAGGLPSRELLDGVIILVSGALLITPGVFSDIVGLIGLVPATRKLIRNYLNRRIRGAVERGTVATSIRGFSWGVSGSGIHDEAREGAPESGGGNWQGNPRDMPHHRDPESS
jgi:UPF0716 protein FxsA